MRLLGVLVALATLLALALETGPPPSAQAGWGLSHFYGRACLHTECWGLALGETVVAKIDDVVCGEAVTSSPFSDGEVTSMYALDVLTQAEKEGCAEPGDTVHFFIGGEPATPPAVWEGGSKHHPIHTGPPYASFGGGLTCRGEPCIDFVVGPASAPEVVAYIDGKPCGSHGVSGWLITSYYTVNVASAEAMAGCGTPGAVVTFTIDGAPAKETGIWVVGATSLPLSTDGLSWGDIDCSGALDPIDSLKVLRNDAGLPVGAHALCPALDEGFLFNSSFLLWGDLDCQGGIQPVDALKTLRADAGLSVAVATPCPLPGTLQRFK
jgi:hypothetical protein